MLGSLSPGRRRDLAYGAFATLVGALAELFTIGSLLTFLELLGNPGGAAKLPILGRLLPSDNEGGGLIAAAAILLLAAAVFAAAARLFILWITQKIVLRLGHELSAAIFSRLLRQPYILHVLRNPSEQFASVEKVQLVVYGALFPLIQGLVASVIAVAIIASLFAINAFTTFVAAGAIVLVYVITSIATRKRLKRNSIIIADAATQRMKAIQEALGGIRDIILGQTQGAAEKNYNETDRRFRVAQALNLFISAAPRYLIEAAGIIVIGLLALYLSLQPGGLVAAIPTLGALALGAQRLLPLLQQVYLGFSNFTGNAGTLRDVLELIQSPLAEESPSIQEQDISFEREIVIDGVSLSYPDRPGALRNVTLRLPKGDKIGIMGPSGSGKSSLLDVLTGLLEPGRGEIRIDERPITSLNRRAWQRHIAYVPQTVYLPDASIAHCIAFGDLGAEIDQPRIERAARQAQLHDFIQTLPAGYDTEVGERGVRLSGGQRQRIGIARALYKRASLLILDEATGALDAKTEAEIMEGLGALGKEVTLLVVSHRVSALRGCDVIVTLEAGAVVSAN